MDAWLVFLTLRPHATEEEANCKKQQLKRYEACHRRQWESMLGYLEQRGMSDMRAECL